MARTKLVITDAYQLASAAVAVFTVKKVGAGKLLFNDVNSDDVAAEAISRETPGAIGMQFEQGSIKNTYIRASIVNAGWEVLIEEG